MTGDHLDVWDPVAPPDVSAARAWRAAVGAHFDPGKRWQAGVCVSDDPLGAASDRLPSAIRYDVYLYLRERALVRGTPDWELETWTWRQRRRSSA